MQNQPNTKTFAPITNTIFNAGLAISEDWGTRANIHTFSVYNIATGATVGKLFPASKRVRFANGRTISKQIRDLCADRRVSHKATQGLVKHCKSLPTGSDRRAFVRQLTKTSADPVAAAKTAEG